MRVAILGALFVVACTPPARIVRPGIGTVKLALSNVHVVGTTLLVDSGSPRELADIDAGLRAIGVDPAAIKCAVITHAHADHSGNARALQKRGVLLIAGAADAESTSHGTRRIREPTSFSARVLRAFLPATYEPFRADVLVGDRYDLAAACGVAGEVLAMPGHTPGSVVVIVNGGKTALVGDLFRGGPQEHFYQEDLAAAHANIRALLERGVEWFVLGHDGPEPRAAVAEAFPVK